MLAPNPAHSAPAKLCSQKAATPALRTDAATRVRHRPRRHPTDHVPLPVNVKRAIMFQADFVRPAWGRARTSRGKATSFRARRSCSVGNLRQLAEGISYLLESIECRLMGPVAEKLLQGSVEDRPLGRGVRKQCHRGVKFEMIRVAEYLFDRAALNRVQEKKKARRKKGWWRA